MQRALAIGLGLSGALLVRFLPIGLVPMVSGTDGIHVGDGLYTHQLEPATFTYEVVEAERGRVVGHSLSWDRRFEASVEHLRRGSTQVRCPHEHVRVGPFAWRTVWRTGNDDGGREIGIGR